MASGSTGALAALCVQGPVRVVPAFVVYGLCLIRLPPFERPEGRPPDSSMSA